MSPKRSRAQGEELETSDSAAVKAETLYGANAQIRALKKQRLDRRKAIEKELNDKVEAIIGEIERTAAEAKERITSAQQERQVKLDQATRDLEATQMSIVTAIKDIRNEAKSLARMLNGFYRQRHGETSKL